MGEFVTDLDDSYTTEDYMDVALPPFRRLPTLQSRRPTVSLPLRAHDNSSADQPTEGNTQPTPSFGFPVSARCANTPPTPSSEQRRARGHTMRKGSEKLKSLPDCPKHRPRPVTTTPSQEVFHSITATPGLDDRSFEELRLECYAMSIAITGAIPRPVPPPCTENARDGRPGEEVKVFHPMFAPFVSVSEPNEPNDEEENGPCCDYTMSSDESSSAFTFTAARPAFLS
ncbi:hypothetical protein OH76DRAFT_1487897 [Lentinus brumalis]|uniref:Uncharacterized protein n=1 Tax=Lentinus brumalis TaxID=2498619 RepID=A0A371CT16_9APHY|nr:hypothetical protein OH76DRAFT_1487897 [Polyporus brumalis]